MRVKITGTGFLSPQGLLEAKQIQSEFQPLLDKVAHAVALCQVAVQNAEITCQSTDVEKQKVVACILLVRILEISEAVIILAKGGFSVEVVAAMRNFLDAYFVFGNICKEPAAVPKYFETDLIHRQKLINGGVQRASELFDLLKSYATPDIRAELKAEILERGAQEFQTYTYANNIGCVELYDSFYRIASAATHSTPRSLEDYVTEDQFGNVVKLRQGPQLGDIPDRLYDMGNFLINVRKAFDELFERDEESVIEDTKTALDKAYASGSWCVS